MDDRIEAGSDADLAIQRALEAADLRAGGSLDSTAASVVEDHEASAAESGDLGGAADGD